MTTGEVVIIQAEGMTLDRLVLRRFRRYMPGYVERVLDSNQGLAGLGVVMPVGTRLVLPPPSKVEEGAAIRVIELWR